MSVSFAQAITVVRNDPMRMATATVIAIAIIKDATATLLRTGADPRFAAASSPAADRDASTIRANRDNPAMASGANSEPAKMNSNPAA